MSRSRPLVVIAVVFAFAAGHFTRKSDEVPTIRQVGVIHPSGDAHVYQILRVWRVTDSRGHVTKLGEPGVERWTITLGSQDPDEQLTGRGRVTLECCP